MANENKNIQSSNSSDGATDNSQVVNADELVKTDVSEPVKTDSAETPVEEVVAEEIPKTKYSEIEPGMTIRVYHKIKEMGTTGTERERVQYFEGIVLARKHGEGINATVTVRKISNGVGVEKVFPLSLPTITKIEALKKMKHRRRSKLYFLRRGYTKKLKETKLL